jgi:hypothetical protein
MASKIKVDQIEGSAGSSITIPSGQTLTITDGLSASTIGSGTLADARIPNLNASKINAGTLADAQLPTVPVAKGGTGLTSLGTAGQALKVNSGANGFEFGTAGGILQVLQAVKTDTQSFSGLSTTFSDISGLSVTITPSSSSSKFLIISSVFIGSGGNPAQSRLMRGTTPIFIGDSAGSRTRSTAQYHGTGDNLEGQHHSYSFLDSPASSSAITYKPQLSIGGNATHYVNRVGRDNDAQAEDNRLASSFIVMEVGV